jgi:hypothetical protein
VNPANRSQSLRQRQMALTSGIDIRDNEARENMRDKTGGSNP